MFSGSGGCGGWFCFLGGGKAVLTKFGICFESCLFEADDVVFLVLDFGDFVLWRGFHLRGEGVDDLFETYNGVILFSCGGKGRKGGAFIGARSSGIHMFKEANLVN